MPNCCKISRNHTNMCSATCAYTVNSLKSVGQSQLQVELKAHSHPTSRRLLIPGKPWANVQQLTQDLVDHYLYFHYNETI